MTLREGRVGNERKGREGFLQAINKQQLTTSLTPTSPSPNVIKLRD